MTKKLSIATIKKELMNTLLGDMRIINSFTNKEVKKASDYIGRNIFSHLTEDSVYEMSTDTYIHFDVQKSKGYYDVSIQLKAHKDLLEDKDGANLLDSISEYVEEIVAELFPYHKFYSDSPVHSKDYFGRRYIHFTLREKDLEEYVPAENDKDTMPVQEIMDNFRNNIDINKLVEKLRDNDGFKKLLEDTTSNFMKKQAEAIEKYARIRESQTNLKNYTS